MWFLAAVTIASFVVSYWAMKQVSTAISSIPGEFNGPTAEEGRPIPVLFGRREITNPNILWFYDPTASPNLLYVNDQNSVLNYRYFANFRIGLCHGQLDGIYGILVGEKLVWTGTITPSTNKYLPIKKVFDNDERPTSDGVEVGLEINFGIDNAAATTDSGVYSAANKKMGYENGIGPRGFGVATITVYGMIGTSQYMRPWSVIAQRIHTRDCGLTEQWYDEKAEIRSGLDREDVWKYKVQAEADSTDYSSKSYDDSGWDEGRGGIGNAQVGTTGTPGQLPVVNTCIAGVDGLSGGEYPNTWVEKGMKIWLRADIGYLAQENLVVRMWHDDSCKLWFNGTEITVSSVRMMGTAHFVSVAEISKDLIDPAGVNVVAYRVQDSYDSVGNPLGNNSYIYAGIQVGPDASSPGGTCDMNAIHIIREVLTDAIWGPGLAEDKIDDDSFTDAADTVYDEKLGLSVLWDRQGSYRDFIAEILRHINGILYKDRITGKTKIKLIREDYDVEELITLDAESIEKIEEVECKTVGDLINTVIVTYSNSLRGDSGSAQAHDSALIGLQGGQVCKRESYPAITNYFNASKVAFRDLRALATPTRVVTFLANRAASGLNPGDAFILDWPDLEFDEQVARVLTIELGDGRSNQIRIKAIEDVYAEPIASVTYPGIVLPPIFLDPIEKFGSVLTLARAVDPLNRGQIVTCYTGYQGCGEWYLFSGWTEIEPGVMQADSTGPLTYAAFDGTDPDAYNPSGVSWLIGKTVLAYADSLTDERKKLTGPYVIDDVGGHYENYGTPEQTYVNTYAKMHRAPGYTSSGDFEVGMTFQSQSGNEYGTDFISQTSASVTLGTTPIEWSVEAGPTKEWETDYCLLAPKQMEEYDVSPDTLVQSVTGGDAEFAYSFPMVGGYPNVRVLPSGNWKIEVEGIRLVGEDPGGTIVLGAKIYRDQGETGQTLFEITTADIHTLTDDITNFFSVEMEYAAPEYPFDEGDILVARFFIRCSTGVATVEMIYNSSQRGSRISVPFDPDIGLQAQKRMMLARRTPSYADGVITIPDGGTFAELTIPAGDTVIGITTEGHTNGDVVTLTIHGATGDDPEERISLEHESESLPDGVAGFYTSSEANMGDTFEDVYLFTDRSRMQFQFVESENIWQLMPGGVLS